MSGAFTPAARVSSILLSFISFGINGFPVIPIGLLIVLIRIKNRYDAPLVEALGAEKRLILLGLAAFCASSIVFTVGLVLPL